MFRNKCQGLILLLAKSSQVFPITEKLYIGLTGLASDVLSVNQLLNFKCNLYKLRENREIKPEAFSAMLSSLLYEKRYALLWYFMPFQLNYIAF